MVNEEQNTYLAHRGSNSVYPLSYGDVKAFADRIRKTMGKRHDSDALILEIVGNRAHIYSPLEEFKQTECTIDMQTRTIMASSGFKNEGEGPNHVLNLPFFFKDAAIVVDGHTVFLCEDSIGRITHVNAIFRTATKISHVSRSRVILSIEARDGDDMLELLPLFGGHEDCFFCIAAHQARLSYRKALFPIEDIMASGKPYKTSLDIRLFYDEDYAPFHRPRKIQLQAKADSESTHIRINSKINNDLIASEPSCKKHFTRKDRGKVEDINLTSHSHASKKKKTVDKIPVWPLRMAIFFFAVFTAGYFLVQHRINRDYTLTEVSTAINQTTDMSPMAILSDFQKQGVAETTLAGILDASQYTLRRIKTGESDPTRPMEDAMRGLYTDFLLLGKSPFLLKAKYSWKVYDQYYPYLNPLQEKETPKELDTDA